MESSFEDYRYVRRKAVLSDLYLRKSVLPAYYLSFHP